MSPTPVHGICPPLARAALAATLLLTLTACATGYHSASNPILGFTGGYWDEPGPGRTWRVGVTGDAYLSPERAGAYLLYRCAEVSLREGGTHFVVYPSLAAAVSDDRQAGLGIGARPSPMPSLPVDRPGRYRARLDLPDGRWERLPDFFDRAGG